MPEENAPAANRTPLSVYADRRIAAILGIGFASGLPFIMVNDSLSAWLSDADVDVKAIGVFGLVTLPWSLKFLWAPLVDRFQPPARGLGRRRAWLLWSQVALALVLPLLAVVGPDSAGSSLQLLAIFAIVAATISATQDIVASAYMVDALEKPRLGAGAAAYVTGYRLASIAGGALLLILSDEIGWRWSFVLVGGLMGYGVIATLFAPEPQERAHPPETMHEAIVQPVVRFARDLGWGAVVLVVFAFAFRLPDQLGNRMTMPLLIQELGFEPADVGAVRQFLGMIITILGAVIGGFAVARIGLIRALILFGLLQALSNGGFWLLARSEPSYSLMVAVVLTEGFCSGLVSAGFIAFLMSCCDRRYSATQYAILTGLMGLAGAVAPAWSGYLVADVGYADFFLLTIAAGVPGMLMIPLIRNAPRRDDDDSFRCEDCGYDLRGLTGGRCPECGLTIAESHAAEL